MLMVPEWREFALAPTADRAISKPLARWCLCVPRCPCALWCVSGSPARSALGPCRPIVRRTVPSDLPSGPAVRTICQFRSPAAGVSPDA